MKEEYEKFIVHQLDDNYSLIHIEIKDIPIEELKKITEMLKDLTDFRNNAAYKLLENSVMITFIGLLSACNEWTEIHEFAVINNKWFSKFLDLKYDDIVLRPNQNTAHNRLM